MNDLETGKDKIKKICEILKDETLEPAKEEAQRMIAAAQQEVHDLIRDAEKKREELLEKTRQEIEKERRLFETSLGQAATQAVMTLKQEIETRLFNDGLNDWIVQHTAKGDVAAKLISALLDAIEKEGTSADFSAVIPRTVSASEVNALLGKSILSKLREKSVVLGDFIGGVQLKLHDRKLLLDMSDHALRELLARFIRKDFRSFLFQD